MTLAQARVKLSSLVEADISPALTDDDLETILADCLRYGSYTASTAYSVGDRVRLSNSRIYECVVAGSTGATQFDAPDGLAAAMGQTFRDGTGDLIWRDAGPDRVGAYDIGLAEQKAWLKKAAKVAPDVDYSCSGLSIKASQEAAEYRRRAAQASPVWIA
jgi:hypothetical protein